MSEFLHKPVMLREVMEALRPQPGGRFCDGTVGGGGHAAAVLRASEPGGRLFGCDRDEDAVEAAARRLAAWVGRFELRRGRFDELPGWVEPESCDGVLLDLGVSSPQFDRAERGFSFQRDGPLDMRMDRRQTTTAAELLGTMSEAELATIFWEFGEERQARRMARRIVDERGRAPIETTRQLAHLIEAMWPRHGAKTHPATKVFQALRLAVNDEMAVLERGVAAVWGLLKPGGRLVVITFHSLEDRIVKNFGRERGRDYTFSGKVDVPELRIPRRPELRWVSRKAIQPTAEEMRDNPRARSAQLRVMEKI